MKYYYQKRKPFYKRFIALICILAITLACFSGKMAELQLVNADVYLAQADTSSHRTLTIHASRGQIIDRYGRPLVINREGFNIVFVVFYVMYGSVGEKAKTVSGTRMHGITLYNSKASKY